MSKIEKTVEFNTIGDYGSTMKSTLKYIQNNSCDITTFYDENDGIIFSFDDTMENNIFSSMLRCVYGDKCNIKITPERIEVTHD